MRGIVSGRIFVTIPVRKAQQRTGGLLTDDNPRAIRTPRFRSSHQRSAPTSPAAPVPDAKYLNQPKAFRPSIVLVLREEHVPDVASPNYRRIGGRQLQEGEPTET